MAAEATHRGHAIIEQVIADLKASALAHLPSGRFTANAAWLVLACLAFNLTRAAGALASRHHARATTQTIRHHLVAIPARTAHSAHDQTCTCPTTGPGRTPPPPCSTPCTPHPSQPEPALTSL
ncbi:transposase [Pseudofrankia sp. DC12]|uniref:transposase n=1 Tax=Pseudofrankia sp. DC12 TaxID=683315 RepID=UPI000696FEE8